MKEGKTTQSRSTAGKTPRKSAARRSDAPASGVAMVKARKKPAPKSQDAEVAPQGRSSDATRSARDEREALIARIAYFRAEARGFAPGHELDDWYAAEAEIEAQLA
jgi:hypothetical protein